MNFTYLIVFLGLFFGIMSKYGIEPALAFATLASGVVWLAFKLGVLFPEHRKTQTEDGSGEMPLPPLVDYAKSFFPIFLVVILLRGFIAEPFRIPSGSMMPTLLVGDFILVNKFAYGLRLPVLHTKVMETSKPKRGDVFVFRYPKDPNTNYIKRLVGLPGDLIQYSDKDKVLRVNGQPVEVSEVGPYNPVGSGVRALGSIQKTEILGDVPHAILNNPARSGCPLPPQGIRVPEGQYFAMGDNRDDSNDSRCWGFVPEENMVGKAYMIWLSFDLERSGWFDFGRIGQKIN